MGEPMTAAIRLESVVAGYRGAGGPRRVLTGLDLMVERGEMVALLGANGSGKTTLLNVVAGTLRPAAGSVELFGRPLADWSRAEIARSVAVLPQSLELPAGFRVAEVVAMGRTAHGARWFGWTPDDLRAVEEALRDADALELAERPVTELSGGERQRVLVALALAQEPSLLLLDEPTTHLDVAHAGWLLANVARLRQSRGLTVVTVLHDLVLAGAWAPRVVVLHGGRIVADGPPEIALRPDVVRDAYGMAVETVVTAAGRRLLVPHVPASAGDAVGGPAGPPSTAS
jgi:iron complex transport system ATP-binding protein